MNQTPAIGFRREMSYLSLEDAENVPDGPSPTPTPTSTSTSTPTAQSTAQSTAPTETETSSPSTAETAPSPNPVYSEQKQAVMSPEEALDLTMAKHYYQKFVGLTDELKGRNIHLDDLAAINGVKCTAFLRFTSKKRRDGYYPNAPPGIVFGFEISADSCVYDEGRFISWPYFCKTWPVIESEEELVKAFRELREIVPALQFDKKSNKFLTATDKMSEIEVEKALLAEFVAILPSVDLSYEGCCVCSDNTLSKTHCGHFVCIPCCDRITRAQHGYDSWFGNKGAKPCPMCRKDISCINKAAI